MATIGTTNGMQVSDFDAAASLPGFSLELGNQVDEWYGKNVATAGALPASGRFPGQRIWLVDVKGWAVWDGARWIVDTAWVTPTLSNSWVSFGAPYGAPMFRRKDGWVKFKGMMRTGTTSTTVLTLPVGSRPIETQRIDVPASTGIASIDIEATGIVKVTSYKATGDNTAVSLAPIAFIAEQ